jgi:pimeloyl-ACP methyl ester carboxylesterase
MKTKITLSFILLFSLISFAQDKSYDLLREKTQTNILYDRVFQLSKANEISNKSINSVIYNQVYNEMQRADFLNRLPNFEKLKKEAILGKVNNQIPLSILISDFETIKKSSLENGDVFIKNNQFESKQNAQNVFDKTSLNLFSPLVSKSKSNTFILKDDFIFNTTSRIIAAVYIKSSENENWIKINNNQPFQIQFNQTGKQVINTKIEFTNSETIEQSFEIEVVSNYSNTNRSSQTSSPNVVNAITATIPYQGYGETAGFLGYGEYEIFLDTTNGVLDKPIFLIDGFDPGDTRDTSIVYDLLNYGTSGQNLATDLRALGYDVIILNFPTYTSPIDSSIIDGGADYIQRNAMILVELINQINAQKIGTEQNVVIGPSMGGLIARYALRYMEQNSLNHDTRLYLSFDSPHQGANVPIGMQHLFNYLAYGPLGNAAVQPVVDGLLKSSAAREMLIDQFEGHLQSGSTTEFTTASASLLPTGCPNYRTAFQNELNAMGFPLNTRNIAIANGAGNGAMNYNPDFEVMNHTFNITSTQRAIINNRFTPNINATNQVSRFRGQQNIVVWITLVESLANSKAPTYTAGLDSAPGGRFDMSGFAAGAGTDPLLTEFFDNLMVDYFTFIPTWSSMAVSGTNNLYANVNASSTTPFAASYIPSVNENHVTLTAENLAFALNEILNPVLSNYQNVALQSIWIKNPVQNSIEINSNYAIENASITVTDVLGKTVFSIQNQIINGTLDLPVSINQGIYFVTIKNESGSIVKKIIKN